MNNDEKHIDPEQEDRFFRNADIPYSKSKDEVWENLMPSIEEKPQAGIISLGLKRTLFAAAASVIILLSIAAFLRYYKTSVSVPNGQHLAYKLPDGSSVHINAQSNLSYHPYWWRFSRILRFEGEGYFEVEKGNKFRVISRRGTTEVLGTSFNVYSREKAYHVACLTGKVKVSSRNKEEAILSPGYQARIVDDGNISVSRNLSPEKTISWTENGFSFTATTLISVFREIERQYDITIILNENPNLNYTGFFSKDKSAEEVLDLVCKPFGFTFIKQSEGIYKIVTNQ